MNILYLYSCTHVRGKITRDQMEDVISKIDSL